MQIDEPVWHELIEFFERGAIPRHQYYKSTLDQFVQSRRQHTVQSNSEESHKFA